MRSLPTESTVDESSALSVEVPESPHSPESVGRLQMASDFVHQPVLITETTALFAEIPSGVVVDATVGGGSHATALLTSREDLALLGVDRDPVAREAAITALSIFGERALVVPGTFDELGEIVRRNDAFVASRPIVGVLMDLGVSSPQLDAAERGFSYRSDAPLDMRMDQSSGVSASELLATMSEDELVALLREHGETRFARSIARHVKAANPVTTAQLVAAVEQSVPAAARRRGHVAARVFQALRVAVNDEAGQLQRGLEAAFTLLATGGVLVVISYHSGEDREVKRFLADAANGGCTCPSRIGCVCGAISTMRVLKASAVLASAAEIEVNPRSRSARLRAGWRL
jgi:16S rRNA (cytosine1402-N4)-methyltransferase